jgi:hypothetical protein
MQVLRIVGVISLSLVIFLSGCAKRKPILVVDDWWNVDDAKSGCQMRRTGSDPCIDDPVVAVREFEAQLRAVFASDSFCRDIALAQYGGPEQVNSRAAAEADADKADYQLMLDFVVDQPSQGWSMMHRHQRTSGQGRQKKSFIRFVL